MNFLNKLKNTATELAGQAKDKFKAEGGLEGILHKTSNKVDQLAESTSESLKKASTSAKNYVNDAKETASAQGESGVLGVAKTLGLKLGTDISELARSGYQRIASSTTIQELKEELAKANEEKNETLPVEDKIDLSVVQVQEVLQYFFAATQSGAEWTTATQEGNPKSAQLKKCTYIVNGNDWFNTLTQEGGSGAFDLTIDFLVYQVGADINNEEIAKKFVIKAESMLTAYIKQVKDIEKKEVVAEKEVAPVAAETVKKQAARKTPPKAKPVATETKTEATAKTKPAAKKVATATKAAAKKTVAKKTTPAKADVEKKDKK